MTDSRDGVRGQHLLVPVSGTATALTGAGETKTRVIGEMVLEWIGEAARPQAVRVVRFAIAAASLKGRQGATGTLSISGDSTIGSARVGDGVVEIDTLIPGRINYPSLDRARLKPMDRGCAYQPAFEPCSIRVSLSIGQRSRKADGRIVVACTDSDFEPIVHLALPLGPVDIRSIRNVEGELGFTSNSPYDPCIGVNRRTLPCRPVVFRSSATDTNPTGSSLAAQFAKAQAIWGRACIDFDILPAITITDATLKTSANLSAIRASRDDLGEIEVFVVANPLTGTGGGNAGAIGQASCQVVIAEPNTGNPVLLAHELGHVINMLHPNGNGSHIETVMQPTGSAMNPGKEAIVFPMISFIMNPLMTTTGTPCCLSPDKADHFIRDFPADVGQEPSDPLPAGMTRFSMSNVWNRNTNTTGGWSAATGPDHQSPYRYESDGVTPALNYLFARVEQRNNLPVGSAQVKFYLKTPGSGGGSDLTYLGAGNVQSGLTLGTSRDASLTWIVPAGAPAHSCCFAVVTSPEEPEGVVAALDWAQFEDMSRQDNDWAQRNLDIINIGNIGGNVYEAAPWLVQLPRSAKQDRLPLTLAVHASGSMLVEAEVEIPGVGIHKIRPDETSTFKVKRAVAIGEDCPVIVRAVLADRPRRGKSVTILIDPTLGKQRLVGFGTEFRFTGTRPAMRTFLDRTIASAVDVSDATDDEAWHELAAELRGLAGGRCPHFAALAGAVRRLRSIRACVETTLRWPLAERYGLQQVAARLVAAIEGEDAPELNAGLWSFLGRAQMAVPMPE